jgi:hypothetical protein
MCGTTATKVPTLHHTLETMSFGNADSVHEVPFSEAVFAC